MTPEERNLLNGLFDRMRSYGNIEKEREADQLIGMNMRQSPDAAYMLVQSVLVQDQALATANDRVLQLEARVRDLEARGSQPSSGGSFLGGLFGGGARQAPTSVPQTRAAPSAAGGPWGQPAPQYQAAPAQPPQQGYAQPQAAPPSRGGGFLAQAMTTAAGVAGGMLVADSIRNMMGGHQSHGAHTGAAGYSQTDMDAAQDQAQDQQIALDNQQQGQDYAADDNDPGTSPASDDSWGGGSDSTDA